MSRENIEVVRRTYDAYGSPKLDAVAEADWCPQIEWHGPEGIGVMRGRLAVLGYLKEWYDSFEDLHAQLDEIVDAGDQVVAVHRVRGHGRMSGAKMEARMAIVFSVQTKKIARAVEYATRGEALEAVGLQ